jgi:hypothetical protein
MTLKSRSWNPEEISGQVRSSAFVPWTPYFHTGPTSIESINGESNSWNGHSWSGGSGMYLYRSRHVFAPETIAHQSFNSGGTLVGTGTTRIGGPTSGVPALSIPARPSDSELDALGTTAIARTEPTAPAFDLSVFLGELMREGIPAAPGAQVMERTNQARKAGSEYLNTEFGWLPLVRGVNDFASTVSKADDILRQYQRASNQLIKRSYEWPTITANTYVPCNFSTQGTSRGFFTGGGRFQYVVQRKWFEAAFTYHLPVGSSANDKFRRYGSYARKLLGVDISPEVLWNLAPWSWAVDWFSNVGDVIHNVSAMGQDGMVMRYGYIMCHTQRVTTDTGFLGGSQLKFQTHTWTEEWKTRRPATPFGFGVAFSGLSPRQLAIVSALGLSRW